MVHQPDYRDIGHQLRVYHFYVSKTLLWKRRSSPPFCGPLQPFVLPVVFIMWEVIHRTRVRIFRVLIYILCQVSLAI